MSDQGSKIDDGSVVPQTLEGAINSFTDYGSIREAVHRAWIAATLSFPAGGTTIAERYQARKPLTEEQRRYIDRYRNSPVLGPQISYNLEERERIAKLPLKFDDFRLD